jgi:hypothetical protein
MSEDAHFHHWELGFKQSGLRHITRALRGSAINTFTALHAFPPCCCPLALSRPGQVGDPEASSFRTSTLCESDPTPSETAQLPQVTGSPGLGVLRGLRPIPRLQRTTRLSHRSEWHPGSGNDAGWFPCSLRTDRSAWYPALPRQHRHGYAAGIHRGLPTGTPSRLRSQPSTTDDHALHPGPYPPDLSRCHAYGALALVPLVYRLISLAGPNPSGSTRQSRLCQRCFPPSLASPGSGCAQLPPGCCDNPARRSHTSFGPQRLTAHQRLVAHCSRRQCVTLQKVGPRRQTDPRARSSRNEPASTGSPPVIFTPARRHRKGQGD